MLTRLGSQARVAAVLATLVSLPACSDDFWLGKQRYLSVEQTTGVVSPKTSSYSGRGFYLVRVNQLRELRHPLSLTYLGSDERFHYLRVWSKAVRDGEVQYVALNKPDCDVSEAASIESELSYRPEHFTYHPWRTVSVGENVCVVGPWSEQMAAQPYRIRRKESGAPASEPK